MVNIESNNPGVINCTFNGGTSNQIQISTGADFVNISDCTFKNSVNYAAYVYATNTNVNFDACEFINCTASASAQSGGINFRTLNSAKVTDCIFENCGAKNGAIYIQSGTVDIEGCTFSENDVNGAIYHTGGQASVKYNAFLGVETSASYKQNGIYSSADGIDIIHN